MNGVFPEDKEGKDTKDDEEFGLAPTPSTDSTNLFVPRIGEQWSTNGGREALFSVFPMHGLPLISSGDELEMDGFEKLKIQ